MKQKVLQEYEFIEPGAYGIYDGMLDKMSLCLIQRSDNLFEVEFDDKVWSFEQESAARQFLKRTYDSLKEQYMEVSSGR